MTTYREAFARSVDPLQLGRGASALIVQRYRFNDWPQLSRIGPREIIDGVLFESYAAIARIGLTMIVLPIAYVRRNPFRKCFARRLYV